MKRAKLGTLLNVLAIASALAGLGFYLVNTGTTYFVGLGRDNLVIGTVAGAIAALLLWCLIGGTELSWKDLLPVISPALLMVGMLTLANSRVNGIAAIMTFENNEQNMADLKSAILALAALLIAALISCLAAFFNVKKKA